MTALRRDDVTLLDGLVTGRSTLPDEAADDSPIIAYLHGGGSSSREPQNPPLPIFDLYAGHGFRSYSLDRPGYGGSAWLGAPGTVDHGVYAASAERLDAAIAELWGRVGGRSCGVVLHGCSVGAAVALHIARLHAAARAGGGASWPLLGVIASDIGHAPRPGIPEVWASTPEQDILDDLAPLVRAEIDFGPDWARHVSIGDNGPVRIPRAEMLEIVGGWVREARAVAAAVDVPVHWRIAEFDPLWVVDPERVAEFTAALAMNAPYVDGRVVPGATHPVHEGPIGRSFVFDNLGFIEYCIAAAREPRILERR
ncbi:MAG: alpha/beta hydrolase [Protaetiibacter sp.]